MKKAFFSVSDGVLGKTDTRPCGSLVEHACDRAEHICLGLQAGEAAWTRVLWGPPQQEPASVPCLMSGQVNLDQLLRPLTCYRNVTRVKTDVITCMQQVSLASLEVTPYLHLPSSRNGANENAAGPDRV